MGFNAFEGSLISVAVYFFSALINLGYSSRESMETALGRSSKESMESEKCLDSELWHACAGAMVQMPVVNSKVYYFPQGHAEHARGNVDFGNYRWIPAKILCRVADVKFLADHESDEVYAKIRLVPVRNGESEFSLEEDNGVVLG